MNNEMQTKQKNNELKSIFKNWKNILLLTFIFVLFTTVLSLTQSLKYGSSMRLLVVQEHGALSDPFAASKSTQYLSNILSDVVYSNSFLNEVVNSGFNIEDDFSKNEQKRKKQWGKAVSARAVSDTGIILITAYHTDRDQAEQIARAVSYVLRTKHNLYHGAGDRVSVRVIESAITSNWPVRPNLPANISLAVIFGLLIGIGLAYLYPEKRIVFYSHRKEDDLYQKLAIENDILDKENKDLSNG